MHPIVFKEFERICTKRFKGGAVLEIGALPTNESLLTMESLRHAESKVGINLDGPHRYNDFDIIKGNANSMTCFENEQFDTVLCNAVLEHDKFFWKTIAEINRVTKIGGLVVIGVPGYIRYRVENLRFRLRKLPILRTVLFRYFDVLNSATPTFEVHNWPGDFYRFSSQTCKEVFLEGFRDIELLSVMTPPRIICAGIKI